ncbi:uncharacterized protein [Macaca nemestrina]|uniref:uncharacterized protein isoform X2 n=1 Tax=Macaca nemestrina TaxID=9545 RepID=UPI0039B85A27
MLISILHNVLKINFYKVESQEKIQRGVKNNNADVMLEWRPWTLLWTQSQVSATVRRCGSDQTGIMEFEKEYYSVEVPFLSPQSFYADD